MIKPRLILLAFLILLSYDGFSQRITGDSLNYLTVKDSIFVGIEGTKFKYIKHSMAKGQTLYSMAKFYGVSLKTLYRLNPHLSQSINKVGDEILIPLPNGAIRRYQGERFDSTAYTPLIYIVKKGDTMYNLSKRILKMEVEEIMEQNEMETSNLEVGQRIRIGWLNINGIPKRFQKSRDVKAIDEFKTAEKYRKQRKKGRTVTEQGTAYWPKGNSNLSAFQGLVAMHKTAKKGSYIRVYNPMSKRSVYLKVLGNIPRANAYHPSTIVVIPPGIARRLKALDANFFVKVTYVE